MTEPLPILQLTDGKPGHENQSHGLIEAIGRVTPVAVERMAIRKRGLAALFSLHEPERPPALIVGAGHRTHLPMLEYSRRTDAPCVVLMKPTLPAALFDICILPEHDLKKGKEPANAIVSKGALNRVPPPGEIQKHGGLVLLGGPSAAHDWDESAVIEAVTALVDCRKDRPWRATDSRRTPEGTLERLSTACPAVATYPHDATGDEWLPQRLAEASEAWVTEDSISMIYESLSSGARVGLLPTPLRKEGRVARGIRKLVEEKWVTAFEDWSPGDELPAPPGILREADRCAGLILQRYFPNRMP